MTSPASSTRGVTPCSHWTFIYVASGLCAVGLFAYLGYALIRAEKF
ncbi:K(+)-transporting ATPase subunit F [Pseudomonas sp. RGB]|nr:K(+)-transporting ATPase subunit F [Pseudomonas sp. RGB]